MAWIESHQELGRHPKTKKFARLAEISLPEAVGILHFIWWWALDYVQSGDLSKYSPDDIADAAMWTQDANLLMQYLTESGFIDRSDTGFSIHDWHEYAGKLLERRAADRERKKNSNGIPTEVQRKARVQNSTVPNLTEPNRTEPTKPQKKRASASTADKISFAEFVSMTNDERSSLVAEFGEEGFKRCVEILDNYKGSTGKRYKSDYRTIKNWVVQRYVEEQAKAKPRNSGGNPFLDMVRSGELSE